MSENPETQPFLTVEAIRMRAHQLWEQAGQPTGRDEDFWVEAESQLLQEWSTGRMSPQE